jgi:hypothetical protein
MSASVTEIWRYPVKSMGGETIDAAAVGERGLHADRMWAVRDPALGAGVLADHYEELGDRVLKMLAEEDRVPGLRQIADRGRSLHRQWCARVFAPTLAGRAGVERRRRLAQLVAICDVYTWKLLRRDAGLSRRQTELALVELLESMMEGP